MALHIPLLSLNSICVCPIPLSITIASTPLPVKEYDTSLLTVSVLPIPTPTYGSDDGFVKNVWALLPLSPLWNPTDGV